jgi:hypothetical protein
METVVLTDRALSVSGLYRARKEIERKEEEVRTQIAALQRAMQERQQAIAQRVAQ